MWVGVGFMCAKKLENSKHVDKAAGRGCRGYRVQMGGFYKVVIDQNPNSSS
jgi:hypothetical protein